MTSFYSCLGKTSCQGPRNPAVDWNSGRSSAPQEKASVLTLPDVIPAEVCRLGRRESLPLLAKLVEAGGLSISRSRESTNEQHWPSSIRRPLQQVERLLVRAIQRAPPADCAVWLSRNSRTAARPGQPSCFENRAKRALSGKSGAAKQAFDSAARGAPACPRATPSLRTSRAEVDDRPGPCSSGTWPGRRPLATALCGRARSRAVRWRGRRS